jgi:Arc/MetJ-type ribon-helix-helix transcriptional regulator
VQVKLTPEEDDLIRHAVDTGRVKRPEDAVHQALELWIERERRRAEILAALDEADASLRRGEGIVITKESMRQLAEDVKRRGRERLAAEKKKARR